MSLTADNNARLSLLDEIVMVFALILRLTNPAQTHGSQQSLIRLRTKGMRPLTGHRVPPLQRLLGRREEKTPAGLQRARHLVDYVCLHRWLEQEQQPPYNYGVELPTKEVGCLDAVALDQHVGKPLPKCCHHLRRRVDGVGGEPRLAQDARAGLAGAGAEVKYRGACRQTLCPCAHGRRSDGVAACGTPSPPRNENIRDSFVAVRGISSH